VKTLVLVFVGMTSAFLAESCQGDRTQGQKSVLKIVKSTVEVHSVWHDIYVATETGGQMRAVVCYSVRLRKSDSTRARDLRCDEQILPQFFFPLISKTAMRKPENEASLLFVVHYKSQSFDCILKV
jgi:hypothetical protein